MKTLRHIGTVFSGLFVAATLSVTLTACVGGPSASNDIKESHTRKGGFMGLATNEPVVATTPAAFKSADKVVVGGFVVGFATYKTDSRKAGGGLTGNGFGGKSTAKTTLEGIDKATMQRITDQAYADFVKDLKGKGYTVVDRSTLTANEKFAKSKTYPSPYEDSSGGIFGTSSRTTYFAPSSFGNVIAGFPNAIPGTMGGIGFSNPMVVAMSHAKENGVKVLNVTYVVDFANADGRGGWAASSSSVEIGQGATIVPEYSVLSLTGGDAGTFSSANGNLRIGQAITSKHSFATLREDSSQGYKVAEKAINVIGVLGGVGSNASREYTFVARPADYTKASGDALNRANDAFVAKMAALK